MKKPLVSILMNCYNGERYLKETLNCVINQTYKNWELIFWDNQSKDNSAHIFKGYKDKRFKYFYAEEHTGLGEARSKAFKYLTGEFIAVLDTDDFWFPDKLEKQIYSFNDKEVGIVISNTYFFNKYKKKKLYKKDPPTGWVADKLIPKYFVSLETLMFRSSYVKEIEKNFDKRYDLIADFDLVVRLSSVSKLAYVSDVLSGWRIHDENDSFKKPVRFFDEKENWIKKIKKDHVFFKKYNNSINELQLEINRHKMIINLIEGERYKAFSTFLKSKKVRIKELFILFIFIIPFSSIILKYLYLRKLKNGL